jgi:NAD(P)-dependent dehydrogenase (short-subunit alcohol dehydrogenase family)
MRIKDKVSIITGGGSGIGRATALLFAKEGAKVVVADINRDGAEDVVKTISDGGGQAFFVETDVASAVDTERMVKAAVTKYGRVDVLFNNAGFWLIKESRSVTDTTEEEWDRALDVNLKGVFLCSKYAIPEMIRNGGGAIVNTASTAGLVAGPRAAAYQSAKAGVVHLTRQMALDYARYNIRINCVCPGEISTPLWERTMDAKAKEGKNLREALRQRIPLGRIGRGEDVARAVLYLVSEESSYVTGSVLVVDGGYLAGY